MTTTDITIQAARTEAREMVDHNLGSLEVLRVYRHAAGIVVVDVRNAYGETWTAAVDSLALGQA